MIRTLFFITIYGPVGERTHNRRYMKLYIAIRGGPNFDVVIRELRALAPFPGFPRGGPPENAAASGRGQATRSHSQPRTRQRLDVLIGVLHYALAQHHEHRPADRLN